MHELKHQLREKKIIIPLLVILALGTFLRFYGIERQSLSNDELSSWKRSSYEGLPAVINEGVRPDVHPPGYQILLYLSEKVIGDSELALRFPSALFGVLSILVIFLIGLRLYSYREAILSAALIAVLWCPVYYSQDARPYAMLLLFTLISSYLWILMVEELKRGISPGYRLPIAYAVTAAICAYTHYFGTYMIALQGAFTVLLFIRMPRALLTVLVVYLAIAAVYLPWLPIMREHLAQEPGWIGKPNQGFTGTFLEYLKFIFNESVWVRNTALVLYFLLVARTYGEFTQNPSRKNAKNTLASPGAVLLLWLFIPFTGVYIRSLFSVPVLSSRNLIISIPPACLLLSRSVMRVPVRSYIHIITVCLAAALLTFHLVFPKSYYSKITKEQFREVVQYLLEDGRIDQCPVILANTNQEDYFNYYFDLLGSDRRVDMHFTSRENWKQVEEIITEKNAVCLWYLRAGKREGQQIHLLRKYDFELKEHKNFKSANLMQFCGKNGGGKTLAGGDTEHHPEPQRVIRIGGGGAAVGGSPKDLWERAMSQTAASKKIKIYRRLIDRFPEDQYAPQALFMIGFIYVEKLNDTIHARETLEKLINRYPESSIIGSAKWMIENLDSPVPPFETEN